MKDQYFGDQNDYLKYDLLIFLAEELSDIKKLSIVWMLTKKENLGQGEKRDYHRGPGNRALFRFLKESSTVGRKVSRLREYFDNIRPEDQGRKLEYRSYGEGGEFEDSSRESYFEHIPSDNLDDAVVFLDPDNGLDVKSASKSDLDKYVKFDEVKSIFKRMSPESVLVVYQHSRHLSLNFLAYGLCYKLSEQLSCPTPLAIIDSSVAFLIVAKSSERRREIHQLLREYVRPSLQILD